MKNVRIAARMTVNKSGIPKLAEDENVNDINGIESSRTTPILSTDSRK
jgi:hypothetical protein